MKISPNELFFDVSDSEQVGLLEVVFVSKIHWFAHFNLPETDYYNLEEVFENIELKKIKNSTYQYNGILDRFELTAFLQRIGFDTCEHLSKFIELEKNKLF